MSEYGYTISSDGRWITDDDGNSVQITEISIGEACGWLLSLRDCRNCRNCRDCVGCAFCYACSSCYDCSNIAYMRGARDNSVSHPA